MDSVHAILGVIASIPGAAWSSLTGVLVGGLFNYLMQRLNQRHQRRKDERDKRRRDLALSISIMLKAAKMYSGISRICRQLDVAVSLVFQHGIVGEPPWQIVQPIVGRMPDVVFSDDERIFIVTELRKGYVTVLEMADIHNDLAYLVQI
jgi:hypothetical protein